MRRFACVLVVALLCGQGAVFAAGGGGSESPGKVADDPVLVSAKTAIARQDWARAQTELKQALATDPGNADYHNLYAYSVRKGPNPDMTLVFEQYGEALRIDPKHRGAHEYIGEAYLQVDNLAKAKEHLAALDRLCYFGCEEYTDLKKAVAAYEAKPKVAKTP